MEKSLNKAVKLHQQHLDVLTHINDGSYSFNDLPHLYKFTVNCHLDNSLTDGHINSTHGLGTSLNPEMAYIKSVGEAVERYCIKVYKTKDLKKGSFKNFKNALNPAEIVNFSPQQLKQKKFIPFKYNQNDQLYWEKGLNVQTNKQTMIPAQLIYCNYKFYPKEKRLRFPLSSGAAGGWSIESAFCRGAYELIERDSFMIFYLNQMTPPLVDLTTISDPNLKKLLQLLKRYHLEMYVFDITTDLKIPSYMAVCIDRTGISTPLSIGLKSHLNTKKAIIGAIEESFNPTGWMRSEKMKSNKKINQNKISSFIDRGMFWYDVAKIKQLDFLFKNTKKIKPQITKEISFKKQSKKLLNIFKQNNLSVYYADVTLPKFSQSGYKVLVTVIPQLHPLFFHQQFPYLGGHRLYQTPIAMGYFNQAKKQSQLNKFPHPFL